MLPRTPAQKEPRHRWRSSVRLCHRAPRDHGITTPDIDAMRAGSSGFRNGPSARTGTKRAPAWMAAGLSCLMMRPADALYLASIFRHTDACSPFCQHHQCFGALKALEHAGLLGTVHVSPPSGSMDPPASAPSGFARALRWGWSIRPGLQGSPYRSTCLRPLGR